MNNRLLLLTLLFGVSIWFGAVEASVLEDPEGMREIMHARSMSKLAQTISNSKRSRAAQTSCDAQLSTGAIPFSCFSVIAMNDLPKKKQKEKWLSAQCLERVKSNHNRKELNVALANEYIPDECRAAISKQIDDLVYASQERFLREALSIHSVD